MAFGSDYRAGDASSRPLIVEGSKPKLAVMAHLQWREGSSRRIIMASSASLYNLREMAVKAGRHFLRRRNIEATESHRRVQASDVAAEILLRRRGNARAAVVMKCKGYWPDLVFSSISPSMRGAPMS